MRLWIVLVSATFAWAQGGPPFRSDDPDTPGNNNWEINVFAAGERGPIQGAYEAPNVDINYGFRHRAQLKFEIPLAVAEFRDSGHVAAGLGNSLMGVKYRFYAHHPKSQMSERPGERESTFGLSVYPQLLVSNPTRSVDRGIVEPGPQFFLPIEANGKFRGISFSAEFGHWFTNNKIPSSWVRGAVIGHEFKSKSELFVEVYDQYAHRAALDEPSFRETTIGIGGRIPIRKDQLVRLIGMVGRSLVTVTADNGQPTWIATAGIQFLIGAKRHSSDYVDPAEEAAEKAAESARSLIPAIPLR